MNSNVGPVCIVGLQFVFFGVLICASLDPAKVSCPVAPPYRLPILFTVLGLVYVTVAAAVVRKWGPVDRDYKGVVDGEWTAFYRGLAFVFFPLWVVSKVGTVILTPKEYRGP